MKLIILKIGGSICTEKDANLLRAKEGTIRRIAREIREALESNKFRLILVHGAGPFGHSMVRDYGIDGGLKTERDFEGYRETQDAVKSLDDIFVRVFGEEGAVLQAVAPHKVIVQKNKKIKKFDTKGIGQILKRGKIPVLYGTMVPDEKLRGSVVSGDAIVAFLAKKFKPAKVLLGTDVDGIFTADPKTDNNAKLIERIDAKNFSRVLKSVEGAKTVDVTGGMRGKLMKLKARLKGTKALIFNANVEGNVRKTLLGEKIRGTELRF